MKRLLPLLGMLALFGCGPTVSISTPTYTNAQESGVIDIAIDDHHVQPDKPVVLLFPKYQPLDIRILSDKLTQTQAGYYQLSLPVLPPDEYRLIVEVPYTVTLAGLPLDHGSHRTHIDFVIHPSLPASCFRFDKQDGALMDWSSHGVYVDNRDKPVSKESCPGLFYINSSWPYALTDTSHGGSLFVPVSSECFPKSSPQLSQQGQWTFALVSPDLRERPDWQDLQGIRFHMATRSINLSVKPEVQYLLNNKAHSSLADIETPTSYDINGGRWNDYEYDFKLPTSAIVTHVVFHVYGVPEKTVSDKVDSVFLDAVCPVK